MADIIDYEDKYRDDFRRLNLAWLEQFNLTESNDLEILDHPQENVINRGGFIYLLEEDDVIVGTAGLFKWNDEAYELIKMCVAPGHRGKGFGNMLLNKCVDKARELGVSNLILFSSSKLQPAIRMYERFGFKHVAVADAPFETADIKMELSL